MVVVQTHIQTHIFGVRLAKHGQANIFHLMKLLIVVCCEAILAREFLPTCHEFVCGCINSFNKNNNNPVRASVYMYSLASL